jgi:hypothetical protein
MVWQKLILDGLPKINFKLVCQKLTLNWFAIIYGRLAKINFRWFAKN